LSFVANIRAIVVPNGEKKQVLVYFIDFSTDILLPEMKFLTEGTHDCILNTHPESLVE